uniref:Uncharacterized protein n=1 Tax=Rhizophora mucronata TaxID=61149 RepID=A0A2P2QKD0_RHIMU
MFALTTINVSDWCSPYPSAWIKEKKNTSSCCTKSYLSK